MPGPSYFAVTNPNTQSVTINALGHFMDDGVLISWYGVQVNADDSRALALLHELAHLTTDLGDDRGPNENVGDAFNRLILQDCFGRTPTQ